MDSNAEETRTLALPRTVVEDIEGRLPRTQFDSADAYAAAALELLLRELDHHGDAGEDDGTPDPEEVRGRLESLGYL